MQPLVTVQTPKGSKVMTQADADDYVKANPGAQIVQTTPVDTSKDVTKKLTQ